MHRIMNDSQSSNHLLSLKMNDSGCLALKVNVSVTGALLHNVGAVMKIEKLPCFSNAMQTISAERSRLEFYLSSSCTAARHTVPTIFQLCFTNVLHVDRCVLLQMNFYRCQISVSIFYTFCLSSLRERCMTGTSVGSVYMQRSFSTVTFSLCELLTLDRTADAE